MVALAIGKCPSSSISALPRKRDSRIHSQSTKRLQCWAAVGTTVTFKTEELERTKLDLLRTVQDTQRGFAATPEQRATVEELLVKVECYDDGSSIDLKKLDGTWRLQYTSASDVLTLLNSSDRISFFQENEGATLLVSAEFDVVSKRNIYLRFEEVGVGHLKISEELQALIAPAILPRSFLSLQILQFLRTFKAQVPLRSPARRSVGGLYYLSYSDRNMLLGRAHNGGGVFIFTRSQPLAL